MRRTNIAALFLLLLAAACGRTDLFPRNNFCVFDSDCPDGLHCVNRLCMELVTPDAGRDNRKRFGESCASADECASGYCVGGPSGAFCSEVCDGDAGSCPSSFDCKLAPDSATDGGTRVPLCTVPQPLLCQSCTTDLDCGGSGADSCLSLEGGAFCGRDCTFDACPDLYECKALPDGRKQCAPAGKTCDCLPETLGLKKSCTSQNAVGACRGWQECQNDGGFTNCNAPPAIPEQCNGVDDDCNGKIDDFTAPNCSRTVNGRTCTGPQTCLGAVGLRCDAPTPSNEVCDYEDDDCNNVIDDPFVDSQGRYVTKANCGGCGNNCDQLIANSSATVCELGPSGAPRCRPTACATGFFLSTDGGSCMKVGDSLCRSCQQDSDCAGPGSRCLTLSDGLSYCGRDCSSGSQFGACPAGYACQSGQCRPTSGTCTCIAANLNATRSCSVSTCSGFEFCRQQSSGPAWTACDVDTYNPEICDGKDNNCNGVVDEGFKNPATGKYESNQSCGFCNNDCTKMFSPTLQHTTGVCNTAPAMPVCTMGACLTENVGGTTFEWVNVNSDPSDGCECRRVNGNTTVDLPDRLASTSGGASYVDENCDGVDGVVTDAIFVSQTAQAGGNGSRTAPYRTIAQGLAALSGSTTKKYVLVAQGVYRENVQLTDGAQLFGGYSTDFLKRDPLLHTSTIAGQPLSSAIGPLAAVSASGLGAGGAETVLSGFTVLGVDVSAAADGQNGAASYGVYLKDCGSNVFVTNNEIIGGRGGRGGRGQSGAQGFGRQSTSGVFLNGLSGQNEFRQSGACAGITNLGGTRGANSQCPIGNGFTGGNAVCPVFSLTPPVQGQEQAYAQPTSNGNGRGGWDWGFDAVFTGQPCGHVTESGYPSAIQSHDGRNGEAGADGASGTSGTGATSTARHGSVSGGVWTASPFNAKAGGAGGTALGGGGGGAGGGTARGPNCQSFEIGATGGGGGAGGCGGVGGGAGGAGGASIALFLTYTTSASAMPTISQNRIQRGLGGDGGNGGFGGAGGQGGTGGFGGTHFDWSGSTGGKGGEGGNGGPGGGGGGGAGGPSFSIFAFNAQAGSYSANNTFVTPASQATGGVGGAGGSTPGSTGTGTAGTNGASADVISLNACSAGCGAGTSCDGNGVCVPN
ncbi:MAG: hypothetical protein ACJ790_15045 [Myxococcaceae bacterium]